MKYIIQITPDDKIIMREYTDYKTINSLVDGWYELCGVLGVLDKMVDLYCNEEALLIDGMQFNSIGSILTNQPIYGNIVILERGHNADGEVDSLPFDKEDAESICKAMEGMKVALSDMIDLLRCKYKDNKPKPYVEIVTFSDKEKNFDEKVQE